jgi:hypothetical protein
LFGNRGGVQRGRRGASEAGSACGVQSRDRTFLGFPFLLLGCRSLCSRAAVAQLSACQLQAGAVGCESGCPCALAPHGAGDCLPRHDPQANRSFPLASNTACLLVGVPRSSLASDVTGRSPQGESLAQDVLTAWFNPPMMRQRWSTSLDFPRENARSVK